MQELHIGEQSILQMAWDSIVMALWEIGLQIAKRLWKKCTTKKISSILLMEIQERKRGRCLLLVYSIYISQRSERLPDWTNRNGFFLIAQWHNVPFQNTNIFMEAYRGHACNFKEAVAEKLCSQSAHVSAQTRSQLYQERKCMCVYVLYVCV